MKRFLIYLSLFMGVAVTASGATLTITPSKSTYEVGEPMIFFITGDPQGAVDDSIQGLVLYTRPVQFGLSATQAPLTTGGVPWNVDPLICGVFSCQAFSQQTSPASTPDGVLSSTLVILALSPGPFGLVWNTTTLPSLALDFFGLPNAAPAFVNIVLPPNAVEIDVKPTPTSVTVSGAMTTVPGGAVDPSILVGSTFSATYEIDAENVTGSAPGGSGGTDYTISPQIAGSMSVEGLSFPIEPNAVLNIANGTSDSWSTSLTASSGNYAVSFSDSTGTALADEGFFVNTDQASWDSSEVRIAGAGADAIGTIDLLTVLPETNAINLNNPNRKIPVAIIGSDTLDVTQIATSTVAFGPAGAPLVHPNGHPQDVNGDGITDLTGHFVTGATGLVTGDTEACITFELLDTTAFEGCDSISTENLGSCGIGFELMFLLPPLMWLRRSARRQRA